MTQPVKNTRIPAAEPLITLTPSAVDEVKRLIAEGKEYNLFLRLGSVPRAAVPGCRSAMRFRQPAYRIRP